MKVGDLSLIESLRADEAAGAIHFKDRRMLLLDAEAMGMLRKRLIEIFGAYEARNVLGYFGYANGYRDALTLKELFDWDNEEEWLSAGLRMLALQGFARVESHRFKIEDGAFEGEAEWASSYEAEQHLRQLGTSEAPVCWALMGYASGYVSAVAGRDVFFLEKECAAQGHERCYLIGKSEWDLDEEGEDFRIAREAMIKGQSLDQALQRAIKETAEMRRLIHELERQQEKVRRLESQVYYLQEASKEAYPTSELVGSSAAFKRALRDARTVAGSDSTVLIEGETGTGKELFARFIHARSRRSERPLVTVNCAALPGGLIESELFGHEKGAFTGALQRKLGRFEIAHGATIFLDEIGELPLEAQAKFLRVLQQGEFERVGGAQTIKVDVRVLAATNRSLQQLVDEGKFRADLYYRLNVFPITIPPLRERGDDLVLLVNYFAQKYRIQFHKKISSISRSSLESLKNYRWPGNVRELENIVERAVLLSESEVLTIDPPHGRGQSADGATPGAGDDRLVSLEEMERRYIEEVLRRTNGRIAGKGGAAEILELNASTLRSRMKRLGIL